MHTPHAPPASMAVVSRENPTTPTSERKEVPMSVTKQAKPQAIKPTTPTPSPSYGPRATA